MAPQMKELKLPKSILDELGGEDALSRGKKRPRPSSRKETRKAERTQKKDNRTLSQRGGLPPQKRLKIQHTQQPEQAAGPSKSTPQTKVGKEVVTAKPKSILKRPKQPEPKPDSDSESNDGQQVKNVKISRAVKDKLAEDDDEIAALEKKLGIKGKKKSLPQSFKDDGLADLFEGLDDFEDEEISEKKKAKADGDSWLEEKRAQARARARSSVVGEAPADDLSNSEEEDEDLRDDDGESEMSMDGLEFSDDESEEASVEEDEFDAENDFDGFDSDEEAVAEVAPRVRENPYIAPISASATTQKYIPPSLRKAATSETEELQRLRRQVQGLVNRLTESNLISILGDIEKVYRTNARHHVTTTLVDLILTSVCEPTSLPDTLIILPAGFIAAVYKIIGTDFGAHIIQRVVELFDEHYARATKVTNASEASKETSNLITLLSELYNFQVVGPSLLYDYIRLFLGELSELNTELLLKLIRASGPQLRQDDPSALKDIVAMLRPAATKMGEENMSVRTKFMIETINDLKNNKMKTGGAASSIMSEHTIRMKKTLGTLNNRSIKASEPLRIGLKDIQESDKKGKWWLVGASWAGNAQDAAPDAEPTQKTSGRSKAVEDSGTSDLVELAREHRMNTDVRRAIFITIMSASDFQDAYLRLMKLKLKRVQELEIPKVLIHCSGGEKMYNPYYTLIAKKLCGDRRLKMAFQFSLWDLFKKMGETTNEDPTEEEEEEMDIRQIVNLAKMFGTLIAEGGLGVNVLKNLSLSMLQPKTKTFIEVLFITIFLHTQRGVEGRDTTAIKSVVERVRDTPQSIRGLQFFLKKVVSKTDIAGGKGEKETVRWACKVALGVLEVLAASDVKMEG